MRGPRPRPTPRSRRSTLNWLIVKPSLVIGQGSLWRHVLMRGLAGLPFVLPLPGEASERFQPIALDDLASGIAKLAARDEPSRTTLNAAGPETLSVRDILVAYRAWLGFGPARESWCPAAAPPPAQARRCRGLARPCHLGADHLACPAPLRYAGRRRSLRARLRRSPQGLQRDAARLARDVAGPAACASLFAVPLLQSPWPHSGS